MHTNCVVFIDKMDLPFLLLQGECDPDFGGMFVFDIHAKELIVGEIFVRVYNEQPTFPLEVSVAFN